MNNQWRRTAPWALGLVGSLLLGCNVTPAEVPPTTMPPPTTPPPTEPPPPTTPPPTTPPTTPPTEPPVVPMVPVGTTPVGPAENCNVDRLSPTHVYGSKVKTLLTGEALTDQELDRLTGDSTELEAMVGEWFDTPNAQTVLRQFFEMAFQQDQVTGEGIMMMLRANTINWGIFRNPTQPLNDLMIRNMQESFGRTVLKMVNEGTPFNDVNTTESFEMTTALMVFYAYLDHRHLRDDDSFVTLPMDEVTGFTILRNVADEPPVNQILNPNSPNFMRIYHGDFDELCLPNTQDEFAIAINGVGNKVDFIFKALLGRMENVRNRGAANTCRTGARNRIPLLTRADFTDWRTVTVRRPAGNETPTRFYNLQAQRNASELVVSSERVGFFTTLGFFGTWPTNEDNSMRVTLNQTLITALGASFDGRAVTDFMPPNLDEEHADPASACYGCHQTLDPMREYFRQSYTNGYGEQHDQERIDLNAEFRFRGIEASGSGVRQIANVLKTHPDFAPAWAQKLCFYANAAPCPEDSEEFEAVVNGFMASNYNFKQLVQQLFASPLVTNAACVKDEPNLTPSIARRDQFCSQLSHRLGVDDICALDTPNSGRSTLQRNVLAAVGSIPADTVSRGEPEPITISETGLFTRATREVVCQQVAERGYNTIFAGMNRQEALTRMVVDLMGLTPADPRHDRAMTILEEHVTDGRAAGATERQALQSALIVSCMSPGVAGVGF